MDQVPSERIRNVAVVGGHGVGKTSLVEALLFHAGAVPRLGRVDDGTSTCDHDPDEISHHLSVDLTLAACTFDAGAAGTCKLNLLDAPGEADFAYQAACALAACDLALVVVSATAGVDARTEDVVEAAAALGVPRFFVVNGIDRDRADAEAVLTQLRDRFGAGIAPLELPLGGPAGVTGVIDLLGDNVVTYPGDGTTRGTPGPIPTELVAAESPVHDALVAGIVGGDDGLMERYLEGDTIGFDELERSLAGGVATGAVFPVVCTSATSLIGIDRLATFIAEVGPSPLARSVTVSAGGDAVGVAPSPADEPLLRVVATRTDPYVGRATLCRVLTGSLTGDRTLVNVRTRADERVHAPESRLGAASIPLGTVTTGDIVVVPKLSGALPGDVLAPKGSPVEVIEPAFPAPDPPVLATAIVPRTSSDDDKLMGALHRLCEEDPSLTVSRVDETHQSVLAGAGEIQLALAVDRLARRFGVTVDREDVRIPYRETVTTEATAEGRHKKQTGGHGQFGVATLRIAPLPRGEGFAFVDEVVGGAIPRQFIPAVRKGVEEAMSAGGQDGYPVVDVSVACVDGKHHPVDSSEQSFAQAGALAFKAAFAEAQPVLLEPISMVEVTVPAELQGDVLGDLSARRGRVLGTDVDERGRQVVRAHVPTAELARYAVDLRAITGGRGRFRAEHARYEPVPPAVAARHGASAAQR
ncbi:MAG: elongation factor G [Actinomycetota bacterium]|nr:elongation factor G [Actinomycetota bacterium]